MTLTLITSASYVADELAAEFGQLPPAFLPVGHKRLYDLQVEVLGTGAYLTVPQSYSVPEADVSRLKESNVTVVPVPEGLTLGQSVLYALEVIGSADQAIRILHGDTVVYDLPEAEDVVAVSLAPESYEWGAVESAAELADEALVLTGYFAFSDAVEWRRSLARAQGSFVTAVNDYRKTKATPVKVVESWLDFGHLQTYYRSRCSIRTQRAFNDLSISFQVVEKRSADSVKLKAEGAWYSDIPPRLKLYTPGFLGSKTDEEGNHSYAIEYLPVPSLHEMFVFGNLNQATWLKILQSCFAFMNDAISEGQKANSDLDTVIGQLTIEKTLERLERFERAAGMTPDMGWKYKGHAMPGMQTLARMMADQIDLDSRSHLGVMHGDLCFTNIFYDFRTQRIRVIDPRGNIDGVTATVFGDSRYDMAKLNHSIAGAYDSILAGRYDCTGFEQRDLTLSFPGDSSFSLLNGLLSEFDVRGARLSDPQIVAITIHLFLSMLPLHSDRPDRQKAFVANAFRLFSEAFK